MQATHTRLHAAGAPDRTAPHYEQHEPSFFRAVKLSIQLRRFTARYFAQLEVELEALCPDEYKAEVAGELAELRNANERGPCWALNHRLEHLMVAGLPEPILRQRAFIHRDRLLALIGPGGAQAMAEAFPVPHPQTPVVELRTATLGALMEIQRLRNVRSEFERLRNRLIAVSMIPGFGFVALALFFARIFPALPLAAIAAIFGLMGGYLSSLLRVSSLAWESRCATNYQQVDRLFWNVFLNFYLCLLEGALGAIILYVVFSSSVLEGSLFPAIPVLEGNPLPRAFHLTHQVEAQLMLWSLVAGFSERLIPDFLTGLSADVTRSKS